mmetsp:Transcript_20037/g.41719  ORF Transcript_20037/g.41719 Transcript_20037/m.41719 type:complete len:114 (+) Transcript_20037:465-806(+)
MKHMAVYLMLVLGGNPTPSAADVKTALAAAGIESDDERLNALVAELEGKDIDELLTAGEGMLAKFGGGGGGGGGRREGGERGTWCLWTRASRVCCPFVAAGRNLAFLVFGVGR